MRLSEAILLGDLLRKRDPNVYYVPQTNCGCAIGGAVLAAGRLRSREFVSWMAVAEVTVYWPWFQPQHDKMISNMFSEICGRSTPYPYTPYESVDTLEALCDVVAGWERDLESKGVNVEQVAMIATPETTHEPAAEHTQELELKPASR